MQSIVIGKIMEIESGITISKNGGGSYKGTRITYRDKEGSLKEQNLHSNALKFNKELAKSLDKLNPGDEFTMTKEKEGEFWNVKSITRGVVQEDNGEKGRVRGNGEGTRGGNTGNVSPRSTYETPEERAQRQIYIVRQSSVTSAIAIVNIIADQFKDKDSSVILDEVLAIASRIEGHVFDKEQQDQDDDDNFGDDEVD